MIRQSSHFTSRIYNRRFAGQVLAIVDSYVAGPVETAEIEEQVFDDEPIVVIDETESKSKGRRGTGDYKAFRERRYNFQVPSLPKEDSNVRYTQTNWYKKGWDAFVYSYYRTANMPDPILPGFRPIIV